MKDILIIVAYVSVGIGIVSATEKVRGAELDNSERWAIIVLWPGIVASNVYMRFLLEEGKAK